jgi:hypothetical protein
VNRFKVSQELKSNQGAAEGAASISSDENIASTLEEQINQRAHEFYEQRGREDGHDEEDWLRAEREILEGTLPAETPGKSS